MSATSGKEKEGGKEMAAAVAAASTVAASSPSPSKAPAKASGFEEKDPLGSASLWARMTFSWVSPMITYGRKAQLKIQDVYRLPDDLDPRAAIEKFNVEWEKEVKKVGEEKASLAKCLVRAFKGEIISYAIVVTFFVGLSILGPIYFFRKLIDFIAVDGSNIGYGVGMAFGIVFSEMARSAAIHQYWFSASRVSVNFRSIVFALVFNKAMKLRDLSGYSIGELVNICSNDGQRVFDAGNFAPFLYISLLSSIAILIASTLIIGPSAIVGVGVYCVLFPTQAVFAKFTGKWRHRAIGFTDRRVRMMSEILNCIKLIKMYAWEKPFSKQIYEIRKKERDLLHHAGYLQSIIVSLVPVIPVLATVATILVHAFTADRLTSADIFAVVALFTVLRFSFAVLPLGVKAATEASVGLARLKKFLLLSDTRDPIFPPDAPDVAVAIQGATFAWPGVKTADDSRKRGPASPAKTNTSNGIAKASAGGNAKDKGKGKGGPSDANRKSEDFIALKNINLTVKKGELVGICGAVGSGKSSIISAILAQMKTVSGRVCRDGKVSYVSQQAWIQSASLRDNVLFGEAFDEERYQEAIDVCCLQHDLRILPAGDQTEIGERGINLSGGQRQRVSMARAVYVSGDIFLLDDPLSAVDAHVGKRIFEKCIRGVLKGKTVIFVTHQLQYLPKCDRVVFVDNGEIVAGTYKDLHADSAKFRELMSHNEQTHNEEAEEKAEEAAEAALEKKIEAEESKTTAALATVAAATAATNATATEAPKPQGALAGIVGASLKAAGTGSAPEAVAGQKLVKAEAEEVGSVSTNTYMTYARAGGGIPIFIVLILLFVIAMSGKAFSDWYLSFWLRKGDGKAHVPGTGPGNIHDNPNKNNYALYYALTAVGLLVLQGMRGLLYTGRTLAASSSMHNKVFYRIVRAPMAFFDTTPTGRILNRFSKDMDEIDVKLPSMLEEFLQNGTLCVVTMAFLVYIFPWMILALIPILIFFLVIVRYFRPAQTQLKRIDNTTRSPLFSHLMASLQGLATIHAFERENLFIEQYNTKLTINTRAFFAFFAASRWFAFRLDFITTLILGCSAFLSLILKSTIDPSLAALSIVYALSMGGMFQYTTRLSAEVEARFTSVERIHKYIEDTPQEAADIIEDARPRQSWPENGEIVLDKFCVRYRPELPLVLNNVSLRIRSNEKIGIVGRTGSGKSTLGMCIFRLMEASSGRIMIDGVDIATIGLEDLRSHLSIIPQDPTLFVGTVRYNLDPFSVHTDQELWSALERAHIKDSIAATPEGLEAPVVENGDNFSVGERQLLCMARALLRHSKILIMDEATAAIDTHTDALIQSTIRSAFVNCTVLTVAHRLNTILDSDKILVLQNGEVLEFDTPESLMANPASEFAAMLASSGLKQPVMAGTAKQPSRATSPLTQRKGKSKTSVV